jgi:hypothetical protein
MVCTSTLAGPHMILGDLETLAENFKEISGWMPNDKSRD